MKEQNTEKLLSQARQGDPSAREELILRHKPFITKVSSRISRRYLTWGNDDELSIAMIAFNEAIDTYRPGASASFLTFAHRVISFRLVDFFRKEGRHKHVSLSPMDPDDEEYTSLDETWAWDQYRAAEQQDALAEIVENYTQKLLEYGISLDDLIKVSPKHRDTKQNLLRVAGVLAREQKLLEYLRKQKQLPLKELAALTGVSRRVLEKGRKYLIALVLILTEPEFFPLKRFSYFDF